MDSSDDDNCYVNSVNQLKALKKKILLNGSPQSNQSFDDDSPETPCIYLSKNNVPSRRQTRKSSRKKKRSTYVEDDREEPEKCTSQTKDSEYPIETICLPDSDSDELTITSSTTDKTLLADAADENYEMIIKVNWRSVKLERIPLRKYQQFSNVFAYFATMENIPQSRIWLVFRNNTTVQPSDTPDSLGLSIVDILEGGIIDGNTAVEANNTAGTQLDKDSISLKVQTKDQKKTMNLSIRKNQTVKVLIIKCAELLNIPENKIRLQFDGEPVKPDETAESLDLEGGECFDMYVIP